MESNSNKVNEVAHLQSEAGGVRARRARPRGPESQPLASRTPSSSSATLLYSIYRNRRVHVRTRVAVLFTVAYLYLPTVFTQFNFCLAALTGLLFWAIFEPEVR